MRCRGFFFFLFFLLIGTPAIVSGAEKVQTEEAKEEQISSGMEEELLGEMDLSEVQDMMDEMLGEDSFSFTEAVKKLMKGEELLSKEAVQELLRGLFFSRFEKEKGTFMKILLLILAAAVFANFAEVFDNGQIGEVSFYVVYLLLFMLLMESFSELSGSLNQSLEWITRFMQVLSPAYFLAVAASSGTSTALVFYQGVLVLIWLIQWVLLTLILPAVNLYVILELVNHLSREEMLGKLSELLNTVVSWGLKTLLGFVVGLQVVRGMVAPVIDSLKRTAIGKTAAAIPGVGNAVNMVTELVVTSAVLVRNSLGAAFLLVFVLVGAGPVIHYGFTSLSYRFLAAIAQPVSDKRMVGCLATMGEGCGMLLRVLLTTEILCMLTFMILAMSFGGGA
ncbi:MAG TPA: stage III sporulation protein AE [Candidatus Blautia faecavium]|uniref:Stage III sporulation protein AE n=1 Tax=Candidatus Blautia faecavium TaxID=2838487 RepID=A0A9D2LW24_9FIRM|nr:stage III sporulation protein AE [Candidatus Blautia faecavium]